MDADPRIRALMQHVRDTANDLRRELGQEEKEFAAQNYKSIQKAREVRTAMKTF